MKIGIIGIGAIGGTLARKLAEKGHFVKVANSRGKDSVKEFASEIGGVLCYHTQHESKGMETVWRERCAPGGY